MVEDNINRDDSTNEHPNVIVNKYAGKIQSLSKATEGVEVSTRNRHIIKPRELVSRICSPKEEQRLTLEAISKSKGESRSCLTGLVR